jgi:hypothetical protein
VSGGCGVPTYAPSSGVSTAAVGGTVSTWNGGSTTWVAFPARSRMDALSVCTPSARGSGNTPLAWSGPGMSADARSMPSTTTAREVASMPLPAS